MDRFGPGRRAKHLEVQTLWVQQLEKVGLISLNKLDSLGNVAYVLTKHVPRAVLDKRAGTMNYTFSGDETVNIQAYVNTNESYWNQKVAAVEKLPVFDNEVTDELEQDS